ncbi:DUF1427 family protein [Paraburkholderia tropica]|uniref:DUF1427 family protein n=1 Tax=Paraburkholderia tropica TaxID=92647 RepID=UPI002AB24DD2|nr:DUF1427 family protein [Paraburkholderia tropica]
MIAYVISLALGLLVGVFYGVIGIRSPAPPVIALLGLLGIVVGEQLPPIVHGVMSGHSIIACVKNRIIYDEGDRKTLLDQSVKPSPKDDSCPE